MSHIYKKKPVSAGKPRVYSPTQAVREWGDGWVSWHSCKTAMSTQMAVGLREHGPDMSDAILMRFYEKGILPRCDP